MMRLSSLLKLPSARKYNELKKLVSAPSDPMTKSLFTCANLKKDNNIHAFLMLLQSELAKLHFQNVEFLLKIIRVFFLDSEQIMRLLCQHKLDQILLTTLRTLKNAFFEKATLEPHLVALLFNIADLAEWDFFGKNYLVDYCNEVLNLLSSPSLKLHDSGFIQSEAAAVFMTFLTCHQEFMLGEICPKQEKSSRSKKRQNGKADLFFIEHLKIMARQLPHGRSFHYQALVLEIVYRCTRLLKRQQTNKSVDADKLVQALPFPLAKGLQTISPKGFRGDARALLNEYNGQVQIVESFQIENFECTVNVNKKVSIGEAKWIDFGGQLLEIEVHSYSKVNSITGLLRIHTRDIQSMVIENSQGKNENDVDFLTVVTIQAAPLSDIFRNVNNSFSDIYGCTFRIGFHHKNITRLRDALNSRFPKALKINTDLDDNLTVGVSLKNLIKSELSMQQNIKSIYNHSENNIIKRERRGVSAALAVNSSSGKTKRKYSSDEPVTMEKEVKISNSQFEVKTEKKCLRRRVKRAKQSQEHGLKNISVKSTKDMHPVNDIIYANPEPAPKFLECSRKRVKKEAQPSRSRNRNGHTSSNNNGNKIAIATNHRRSNRIQKIKDHLSDNKKRNPSPNSDGPRTTNVESKKAHTNIATSPMKASNEAKKETCSVKTNKFRHNNARVNESQKNSLRPVKLNTTSSRCDLSKSAPSSQQMNTSYRKNFAIVPTSTDTHNICSTSTDFDDVMDIDSSIDCNEKSDNDDGDEYDDDDNENQDEIDSIVSLELPEDFDMNRDITDCLANESLDNMDCNSNVEKCHEREGNKRRKLNDVNVHIASSRIGSMLLKNNQINEVLSDFSESFSSSEIDAVVENSNKYNTATSAISFNRSLSNKYTCKSSNANSGDVIEISDTDNDSDSDEISNSGVYQNDVKNLRHEDFQKDTTDNKTVQYEMCLTLKNLVDSILDQNEQLNRRKIRKLCLLGSKNFQTNTEKAATTILSDIVFSKVNLLNQQYEAWKSKSWIPNQSKMSMLINSMDEVIKSQMNQSEKTFESNLTALQQDLMPDGSFCSQWKNALEKHMKKIKTIRMKRQDQLIRKLNTIEKQYNSQDLQTMQEMLTRI